MNEAHNREDREKKLQDSKSVGCDIPTVMNSMEARPTITRLKTLMVKNEWIETLSL